MPIIINSRTTSPQSADVLPSEITSEHVYANRREFLKMAGFGLAMAGVGFALPANATTGRQLRLDAKVKNVWTLDEKVTSYEDITTYNNFYELGLGKADPAKNAGTIKTRPWVVSVEGLVAKPKQISIDELINFAPLEDRTYRMRCVEGWSMVIPWVGIPLAKVIDWASPLGSAKFVEFITLDDPVQLPGINNRVLD